MMRAEGVASSTAAALGLELRGRSLVLARLVWLVLTVQAVILFAVSVPARYDQLSHPPRDVRVQLVHAGLSTTFYAAYLTAIGVILALVYGAVAVVIVRRRSDVRIGLLASLYLILVGLTNSPEMHAVAITYPTLALPANASLLLCVLFLVGFFLVFPDGRFVPRWAGTAFLIYSGAALVMFVLTGASIAQDPPGWLAMMILGGGIVGIGAQIYRYVRVSDRLQRQQTKWVALGVSGAIVVTLAFAFLGPLLPNIGGSDPQPSYDLTGTTGVTLASLFVPLTLGAAIVRHRLWEIDVVVNRTLVYTALTASLVGLYLAVVNGLDAVLQTRAHLPASLLATALVAVLFAPLRGRLQIGVNRLMYGERDDPYHVLTRLGERAGAAAAPGAALTAIAETVAHALKLPYAAITLGGERSPAATHGTPAGEPLTFPLEYQGERAGELLVAPRGPGEQFSSADRRLLEDLSRQIGPAAYAVRLTADLQRSRERLVTAREEERRRLRRDLHDGLGPQLAALTLKIETIRNRFSQDGELDAALIDLTARTQAVLADIRRLVYGLRPPALDELGLRSALRQAAQQYSRSELRVEVDVPERLPPLPAAVEVAAYRIVQEALANVVRHAAARTCRVAVTLDEGRGLLGMEIVDDGRGLPAPVQAGVGLVSMRERAEELGGRCRVMAGPAGGTAVLVELPWAEEGRRGDDTDSDR